MSRYLKKTEAQDAVIRVMVNHIDSLGGKTYQQIVQEIKQELDYIPSYQIADSYMERV